MLLIVYLLVLISNVQPHFAARVYRPNATFHVNVTVSERKTPNRFICYGSPCAITVWFQINVKCPKDATVALFVDVVPTDYPEHDPEKHVRVHVGNNLIIQCQGMTPHKLTQSKTGKEVPWSSVANCVGLDATTIVQHSSPIRISIKTSKNVDSNHVAGELKFAHLGAQVSWACGPGWAKSYQSKFATTLQPRVNPPVNRDCKEWKTTVTNGDRSISCKQVAPGYYWRVGKHLRDYGFYGVYVSYPAYHCGPDTVGIVGETWRWWKSTTWSPVGKRMCRGQASRDEMARHHRNTPWCNVTDQDGPSWGSCTQDNPSCPCCGIFQAQCVKIPN